MKSLILCAALLAGCGSSNCGNKPELVKPVLPDVLPTAVPTAEPKQVIDWRPMEILNELDPDVCIMAYFPDAVTGDTTIETTTFTDQELVKLMNATFISIKLPVTKENASGVMNQFQISRLPALLMGSATDESVYHVEGTPPADELSAKIKELSEEGGFLEKCAGERAKLN